MTRQINWSKYTPFQRKVYRAIMTIPAGEVRTYGQVARMIGRPRAARAIGQALRTNQDAPVIPCHRVVGYNTMGGYSAGGGMKKKLKLLKSEGFNFQS